MIEVPQNRDVVSKVARASAPSLQNGDQEGHIETTSVPQEERYFLEGPKSRRSEFLMALHIVRDFLRGFRVLHFVGHA